jgi:hypothetical protein
MGKIVKNKFSYLTSQNHRFLKRKIGAEMRYIMKRNQIYQKYRLSTEIRKYKN